MRDFRTIRKFESDWKESQSELQEKRGELDRLTGSTIPKKGGTGLNLEAILDKLAENG